MEMDQRELEWIDATTLLTTRQTTPLIGLYKIVNTTNGKVYIGQSNNIKKRIIEGHIYKLSNNNHRNKFLQRAWIKYGKENFKYFYINIGFTEELTLQEEFWIRYYDSCNNKKGYNLIIAGDAVYGQKKSPEAIEKLRTAFTGENNPNYGIPMSEENKRKLSETMSIKIVQFTFDREMVKIWDSVKEASEHFNVAWSSIGNSIKNKTGSSCGFYWGYYDEYVNRTVDFDKKDSIRLKNKKAVVQLTLTGEYVNTFESITDAVKKTGVKGVGYGLTDKYKQWGGYIWKYKEDYYGTNEKYA